MENSRREVEGRREGEGRRRREVMVKAGEEVETEGGVER